MLRFRANTDYNQIRLNISDLDVIIAFLVQKGANASITDDNESTPLFIAVQYSKSIQKKFTVWTVNLAIGKDEEIKSWTIQKNLKQKQDKKTKLIKKL